MERSLPFIDAKRRTAIKILDDGCGDGFFLDISSPAPRVFYHMLEDPSPRDYGTLEEFVRFIAKVHAAGIVSLETDGMVVFDLSAYEKLEREYQSTLPGG